MRQPRTRQDLALAAPMAHIYAVTTVLLLMFDAEIIAWVAVLASLFGPFAIALYVFRGRHPLSRVLRALWAPVGQWGLLFATWLLVWRHADTLPSWTLGLVTFGPIVALVAASVPFWRQLGTPSARIGVGVLWAIALAEAAAAFPLAEWLASTAGVDTLAAVVVLFAPIGALGTWLGILVAASVPMPSDEADAAAVS